VMVLNVYFRLSARTMRDRYSVNGYVIRSNTNANTVAKLSRGRSRYLGCSNIGVSARVLAGDERGDSLRCLFTPRRTRG